MRSWLASFRIVRFVAIALLMLGVGGCGPRLYPVQGTVTFEDGAPVSGGLVVFESAGADGKASVMARGAIQADGRYELSTDRPGDGVPAGQYRVRLVPPEPSLDGRTSPAPSFDRRYTRFQTSGLEFEVKPGSNTYPIQVARARTNRH